MRLRNGKPMQRDTYNILTVDDEMGSLYALERTFRREYNIFSATNGADALAIMEERDIALIIADHRMPGMTGIEFLEKTWHKYPDAIRIILSAYTDEELLMGAINTGHVYSYVAKPWETEEIKSIVREAIEAYETTRASRELYTRTLLESGIISGEQLDDALRVQRDEKKMIGEILVEHSVISKGQLDMALELQEVERKRLGEALVDLGAVSPDDLQMGLELQRHERRRLAEILVDLGYADEESILSCYALQLGMPYISLSQLSIKPELAELMPSKLAYKYRIVPMDVVGRVLVVAASEPLSARAKSEIEKEAGYKIMAVCTSHRDIEAALKQYYLLAVFGNQRVQAALGTESPGGEESTQLQGEINEHDPKSLRILVGDIAHDFNNILTAISGNIFLAGICVDGKEAVDKILERLTAVEEASMQAAVLTQQLLNFSRGGYLDSRSDEGGEGRILALGDPTSEKTKGAHITAESQAEVRPIGHDSLPASPEAISITQEEAEDEAIIDEGKILVMDDEEYIRDITCEMLSIVGYKATPTIDGTKAIELYKEAKESGEPYNAAILDLVIPGGMDGKATIQKLMDIDPEVKAIVCSGYSNDPIMADFKRYGFKGAIAKPYNTKQLGEVLHKAIIGT